MAKRRFKKLKDRMFEKELTQDEAARMLGRSTTYLSHRLNGHEPFDFADAAVLAGVLDIPRRFVIGIYAISIPILAIIVAASDVPY